MTAQIKSFPQLSTREITLVSLVPIICKREPLGKFSDAVVDALDAGANRAEIREVLLQLTIYAGFPKILEAMKKLKIIFSDFDKEDRFIEVGGSELFSEGHPFNFFKQDSVQRALNEIDKDFAHFALLSAIPLCDRGGITPKERALIILGSDICNEVFDGPFQIHTEMALQSGASFEEIKEVVEIVSFELPSNVSVQAEKLLLERSGVEVRVS